MKKILLILALPLLMGAGCNTSAPTEPIPSNIVSIVDQYIINKVGQVEFEANYLYNAENSYVQRDNKNYYSIYYEYKPASQLSDETQYLVAHVVNGQVQYMNGLYVCNPGPCQISIDKEEAIDIARDHGFFDGVGDNNLSIYLGHTFVKFDYWTWILSRRIRNLGEEERK